MHNSDIYLRVNHRGNISWSEYFPDSYMYTVAYRQFWLYCFILSKQDGYCSSVLYVMSLDRCTKMLIVLGSKIIKGNLNLT